MAQNTKLQPDIDEVKLIPTSFYLHPDELIALDELVLQRRRATGKAVRRNHIVREAIQVFLQRALAEAEPA